MNRRGSVLILSLIAMSTMVIIGGALCTYYTSTARMADWYLTRGRGIGDRMSSRAALSRALAPMVEKFNEMVGLQTGSSVGVALGGSGGVSLEKIIQEMRSAIVKAIDVNGQKVTISEKRDGDLIKLTASINGYAVMSLVIELSSSAVMNTLEIFDYVYFANNNGQLMSSYIIANGDVGSNGNFTLKDATVNGYVKCLGNISLLGSPHAWPRSSYLYKVSQEFSSVFTQVRPTNPAVYESNGVQKSEEWLGGYECVSDNSPYTWTGGDPPEPVASPGIEPKEPTRDKNIGVKETDSSSQPSSPPSS